MTSKVEIHLTKHDRQIAAIQKLIFTGMKMIVKNDQKNERHLLRMEGAQVELRQEQIALRREMRLLSAQQLRTEKTLDRFIRAKENGRNGHS